ncbi:MAG TPA: hypothetical protein VGL13_17390 [Polyangiaceae bacterium]|jgi:hypothetical protein
MSTWLYAPLCVVVPVLWGVAVVFASNAIERVINRRHPPEEGQEPKRSLPPIDYHI